MKIFACIVLFASGTCGFSQCTSTISPTDKIADVQSKLNCLAAENAKLKQELAESQNENGKIKQELAVIQNDNARIKQELAENQNTDPGLEVAGLTPSPGDCTANAKHSMAKRNARSVLETAGSQGFRFGKNVVMVICQSNNSAYLIVGSKSREDARSLADQLLLEIFHHD